MPDFANDIQDDIIAQVQQMNASWDPSSLRDALISLRNEYRATGAPNFSTGNARLAYALAYHPYHALMTLEVLNQMSHLLALSDRESITVTSLGAGAGAEVVALLKFIGDNIPKCKSISLQMLDKESGWEKTRTLTIQKSKAHSFTGEIKIDHLHADLANAQGRALAIQASSKSDVVLAQAILSELSDNASREILINELFAGLGRTTIMLLCDFQNLSGLNDRVKELDKRSDVKTVFASQQQFPMPACLSKAIPLFANEDGLRQRRQVTVTTRAYVRTDWTTNSPDRHQHLVLTNDQTRALNAFDAFIESRLAQVFILEGSAGTGKTELVKQMIAHAANKDRYPSLWAPTGQAAVRLAKRTEYPASTIHSAMYEFVSRKSNDKIESDSDDDKHPPTLIFQRSGVAHDLIFIDEASMIGDTPVDLSGETPPELIFEQGRLFSDILTVIESTSCQVVFIGDSCQLPPYGEVSSQALADHAFMERGLQVVKHSLTEIVRTDAHSEIREMSQQVRNFVVDQRRGTMPYSPTPNSEVLSLGRGVFPESLLKQFASGDAVALAVRNNEVASWNSQIRDPLGRPGLLPVPEDRLVTTRTKYGAGIMNGDELRVLEILGEPELVSVKGEQVLIQFAHLGYSTPTGIEYPFEANFVVDLLGAPSRETLEKVTRVLWVDFHFRMSRINVKPHSIEFWQYAESDKRLNALHISYSYARTTTRAQGGEWDSVILNGYGFNNNHNMTARHVYSAVTRARKQLFLQAWPTEERRELTAEQLVAVPQAIVRDVLGTKPNWHQNPSKSISVAVTVNLGPLDFLLNLYSSGTGVNFHIQKREGLAQHQLAEIEKRLKFWKVEDRSRLADAPPAQLAVGLRQVSESLATRGIEMHVLPAGQQQIELLLLDEPNWASLRTYWRVTEGLSKVEITAGNPVMLDLLITGLKNVWPQLRTS